jgi:hypothetical protein
VIHEKIRWSMLRAEETFAAGVVLPNSAGDTSCRKLPQHWLEAYKVVHFRESIILP